MTVLNTVIDNFHFIRQFYKGCPLKHRQHKRMKIRPLIFSENFSAVVLRKVAEGNMDWYGRLQVHIASHIIYLSGYLAKFCSRSSR